MSSANNLTIGLFGFGVVGEGIYQILQQTPSLQASIRKICVKHPEKPRNAPASLFTTDAALLLNDPEINVIVELIDNADDAYSIVTTALKGGKAVVSANKKLIAHHLPELLQLQEQYNVPFLYEASVCGSIPVIRNLEEYYDNDLLRGICGIVNGSTNYILTKILAEGLPYSKALQQAQDQGFAESDPTLDVEGFDAVNKLTILLAHGYGIVANPDELLTRGITQIHAFDAGYAAEKGFQIKLTAQAKKLSNGDVAAFVLPQLVTDESQLFAVRNEYNGVVIESSFSDKQFLYGKGAGRFPTASAVLSDISALRYQYRYEYRKLKSEQRPNLTDDFYLRVFVSYAADGDVERNDFEFIEEAYLNDKRQFFIGVIRFDKLKEAQWLRKPQVSLLVCPNGIIESIELRQLKKRSLELAGVNSLAGAYLLN
ncbi:homoserine dehydrogenase [Pseudocnuella soli]|uniref:homoserine dehydrogenase n=1 Tax=Pseudocnuella soli TaxID=2502779 RepID=UPI001046B906|nr:homoserine dehydrogenase [Pseudocnuella soli]